MRPLYKLANEEYMKNWRLSCVQHSSMVEYYLFYQGLDGVDKQTPHDLVGKGNKLDLPQSVNFSLQYVENNLESPWQRRLFQEFFVKPGIRKHRRGQNHHIKWKNAGVDYNDEMKVSATDAIAANLQNREYNDGPHSFEDIGEFIIDPQGKKTYFAHDVHILKTLGELEIIPKPKIDLIVDVNDFPNIGIPKYIYEKMQERIAETSLELNRKFGWHL